MNDINYAIQLNKEGIAYFTEGKFQAAITAFQGAIDARPDYIDAYYNLGLALNKVKEEAAAMHAFEAVIALSPDHLGGQFQLGCLWMKHRQYERAIAHFKVIEQYYPDHGETWVNLATCYLEERLFGEAKRYYLKALTILPMDTQILFNLGVIHAKENRKKEAIEFYSAVLNINPDHYATHHNLGALYLAAREKEGALHHFRMALQAEPHHPEIKYMIEMLLDQKNLSEPPEAYLRLLFDSYAEHYDEHLQLLDYQVPGKLFNLVRGVRPRCTGSDPFLPDLIPSMLDLGCGTGLCGALFRPLVKHMVGVDLSKEMLHVAETKQIYDALHEEEILSYLTHHQEKYDLIVAGDVLVYYGNLDAIFAALSKRLKPDGLIALNAEISEKEDYVMLLSGRFAHRGEYIESSARRHGLYCVQHEKGMVRLQDHVAISGHYFLLQLN